jgi:hypothetical protein
MPAKKETVEFTVNGVVVLGKVCTRCDILKPFSDYPRNNQKSDGYNSYCKDCKKVNDKKYYEDNKDKVTERVRDYYHEKMKDPEFVQKERERSVVKHEKYGEKYRLHYRNRYHTDAEFLKKKKIKDKEWRKNNKTKINLKSAKRRYFLRKLPNTLNAKDWEEILNDFNGACALTGSTEDLTIEHFIPLKTGHGGHVKGNVYPIRKDLNLSKSVHNPFEWISRPDVSSIVPQESWDCLIDYLAKQNDLTREEFINYTNWCFANKRRISEIPTSSKYSVNIWRDSKHA